MTKKERRPQSVPGMRTPKGQQKRFNLHIEMPHVDLMQPAIDAKPEPPAHVAPVEAEVASEFEVTSIPEVTSEFEVTSNSEATRRSSVRPKAQVTSIPEVTSEFEVTVEAGGPPSKIEATSNSEVTSNSEATIAVDWKNGYLRLPNWLVFNLLPKLDVNERAAYLELYTQTHGFNRNPHRISQARVAKSLRMSENTLRGTIERLESKGLVARLDTQVRGGNSTRGSLLDVRLPRLVGAPSSGEVASKTEVTSNSEVTSNFEVMKEERKERHERPPVAVAPTGDVYSIRTIAARLLEVHRSDPGFDKERLRSLVETTLVGQGIAPNADLVEEAIKGMAD